MHTTRQLTYQQETKQLFQQEKVCVIIPTYNNAQTLTTVLENVLEYANDVIVVNDGSTDDTDQLLYKISGIDKISYEQNRGKGFALRAGLKAAAEKGFNYAVVLDSDGQHSAKDLAVFAKKIHEMPGALIIGARNMQVENVPQKSSFGMRFSNFWFWVETGIKAPDTQSGYRAYPLKKLADKIYFTRKYEFEIEVIVRASWSGIPVLSVPVSVYYPPPSERISHFRPFKDFTRISILNTVLVLITFLYIKPRDFIRLIFSKDGWRRIWAAVFVNPQETNFVKSASIGFGVFMGIVPIWGFQLLVGIPLALIFRLNKALFLISANISVPPLMFFWIAASVVTGKKLLHQPIAIDWRHLTLATASKEGFAFVLGGLFLAITLGITSFLISYSVLAMTRKRRSIAKMGV